MNRDTLINLCICYINTNYLSVADLMEVLGYNSTNEELVSKFRDVCEPIRDERFEFLDGAEGADDSDLDPYAWELAAELQRLASELK